MRRLIFAFALVAAVSTIALTHIASAADLGRPVYGPSPPPAPVLYNWTGCYIGGNIGYGWGRDTVSIPNLGETTGVAALAGIPFGPATGDTKGVLVGGQVGCNYQFAPNWVVGIEGDGEAADIKGDRTESFSFTPLHGCSPQNGHRNGPWPDRLDCQRHRPSRLDVG